ncbi:ABC transporter substrate-binding protein [Agrobacterium deltaense]|uniref:ABC transporter substrate-binding protein n=1 Tax=Agrobacterium TaxID=357 RepID=UPI00075E9978|nr:MULTISPECIES: ABC transporter substrate-binding protein [Agrobacterium]RKF40673.1 ABC transporter substrate-binding protein [Agrobacterium deltaense]
MKNISIAIALSAAIFAYASQAQADCGTVTIANMNWQSAELLASVDSAILTAGFGCKVELISGDTVPSITSMAEKGQPDIAPEGWVNNVPETMKRGLEEKTLVVVSEPLSEGGVQGLWIPKYFADSHPNIRTIEDVLAHPELFPAPEDSTKGGIVTAPQGWGAAIIVAQLFKAYGADKAGFVMVDPGSAAGLDGSLAKAYERKEPWVGYYWSPTSLLGKYEMVKLAHGVGYDEAEWKRCTTVVDCSDPEPNDWPKDRVETIVTQGFVARAGYALDYLKKRTWSNAVVSQLSAWMTENQASGQDGAKHFLQTYPEVWTTWVSPEVAEKVKAAL